MVLLNSLLASDYLCENFMLVRPTDCEAGTQCQRRWLLTRQCRIFGTTEAPETPIVHHLMEYLMSADLISAWQIGSD
jgi:hypothetical protein